MELLTTVLRTLFFYFFVTFSYRIMGKREVGQLGIVDLIVSILIAELVAISIENIDKSIMLTIAPISLLVVIEVVLAYLSTKSRMFRQVFTSRPSVIINHGQLNYKEMVKQRYSLDDLLLSLRQASIKSIEDVEYAFLENNGKLSVFKYNLFKTDSDYPAPIIVDGKIQDNTLKNIRKNKIWIKLYLRKQNLNQEDIFYAFYKKGKIYTILKSNVNEM